VLTFAENSHGPPSSPDVSRTVARGLWAGFFGVVALTAVKLAFRESIGEPSPFLLYFGAVMLAAWYGARPAGLMVTALCGLIGGVVFIPDPIAGLWMRTLPQLAVFALEGTIVTLITARLTDARAHALLLAQRASAASTQLGVVLGAVDEGITMVDPAGKIVYANRLAAQLCGYASADELCAAKTDEIIARFEMLDERGVPLPPEQLPGRLLAQGRVPAERIVRFRSKQGAPERWAVVRATAVYDEGGALRFVVNMFRDLTEARRNEAALRLSQDWLATALRSIGDAVIATDARGQVMFLNPIAEQLTGWSSEEAKDKPLVEVFPIIHEETRVPVESPVERVLREGKVVGIANHTVLLRRDGGETAIDDSAAPIRSDDGTLQGVVLVFRDVSHARSAQLKQESLAHEAVRANRAKDEFLAMLGHELRNPLAPILTALELMRARAPETFAHERAIIDRQLSSMVRLVDDLLDVSRITEGRIELHKSTVDVADVLEDAVEVARPLFAQRGHELAVHCRRGLMVLADPTRLKQVISNLLTNAAKYTEPYGHVDVSAEQLDGKVVLRVRDDGVGILPEVLPHVFDVFVQGPQAMDRALGGLGLGLSIVRSLVQLHGGEVSAHSDGRGKGAEFAVSLPALDAAAATNDDQPAAREPARAERTVRILLVDDNDDALELLSALLRDMGHDTYAADNAHDALELAARVAPDIGLVDIGLPEIDGYELARRLHALPGLAQVPLIAITGYGQSSDRARARETGFAAHLVKPVSAQKIRAAIAEFSSASPAAS
jgi:PAS domain S-box-containing protein